VLNVQALILFKISLQANLKYLCYFSISRRIAAAYRYITEKLLKFVCVSYILSKMRGLSKSVKNICAAIWFLANI